MVSKMLVRGAVRISVSGSVRSFFSKKRSLARNQMRFRIDSGSIFSPVVYQNARLPPKATVLSARERIRLSEVVTVRTINQLVLKRSRSSELRHHMVNGILI